MSIAEIIRRAKSGEISESDAEKLINEQERPDGLRCQASVAGGVSVYGLQRMPVTLYANSWQRLAEYMPEVLRFIAENNGALSSGKDDRRFDEAKAAAKAKYAKKS